MEDKELKQRYENLIEEISIEGLKGLFDNKQLDINSLPDKIYVVNYLGDIPEKQAEFLLNSFVDNDLTYIIELKPENLFEKIYAVKDYKGQQDIIVIFKDNVIQNDKLQELYSETLDEFKISKYLDEQLSLIGSYKKEEYDPLGFNEEQKKIDDIEEKMMSGELTFGEGLKEFGLIDDDDYNNEKVIEIIEKLVKDDIDAKALQDMVKNNEINQIELATIANIIKKKYPEIDDKLNKQFN